ncbi:hypothetical protein D3C80_792430 [compost metagenome]
MGFECADDKAATMEEHQQRQVVLIQRPIQPGIQLTGSAGHPQVAHFSHDRARDRRQQVVGILAVLRGIELVVVGLTLGAERLKHSGDLLIERHGYLLAHRSSGTAGWFLQGCCAGAAPGRV